MATFTPVNTIIGSSISEAVRLLSIGELVAIPTETVYGLAGNGLHSSTVSTIFAVKDRPSFDPLILHTTSLEAIADLVTEVPTAMQMLAEAFMPGPLSILLSKRTAVPDITTSGLPKVAIRVPAHPLTRALLQELDFPLAAPSANPFGYVSPTSAQHVADQLTGKIPYILDGGPCSIGLESTIVEWTGEQVRVLRKGGVPVEEIEAIVGPVTTQHTSSSSPAAPGMLKSHYATAIPITLDPLTTVLAHHSTDRVGLLSWQASTALLPTSHQRILSATGDYVEAARHLFAYMRELDRLDLDIIVAELLPEVHLGRAINDKLRRASA